MSLRSKVVIALVGMLCLFVGADGAVQRWVFLPSFLRLERDEATKDIVRCREALAREIVHLRLICNDWASWDDTYEHVVTRNEAYVRANFMDDTFTNAKLNLIAIVNTEGEVVTGKARDLKEDEWIKIDEFPDDRLPPGSRLLQHKTIESEITGIMMTSRGPMLVASLPILTSNDEGPSRGAMIMGRFLTDEVIEQLREQTRVDLAIWPLSDERMQDEDRAVIASLSDARREQLVERSRRTLAAYTFASDLQGNKVLALRANVPREISARGYQTMWFATLSVAGAGLVTLLMLLVVLQRMVVGPVATLTAHAQAISASGNLTARLRMERRDEIGRLAANFDTMVARLAQAQRQLADASREAGKAEVASGVLHNVGNVLNSVNVSAARAKRQLSEIDIGDVSSIARLFDQHKGALAEFLTADEKGRLIPQYLAELGQHLSEGQEGVLDELRQLESNIEHIKQVVQMQQDYATAAGLSEPVNVASVINDALGINNAAFGRHHVQVSVDVADLPEVQTDRHKVLQILINLLSNAKYALDARPAEDRRIAVRAAPGNAADSIVIEVTDNGCGIAKENLTRIFAHGFTTRAGGHGFGLHTSALTARELGGTLAVSSDGPGRGASLLLTLPLQPVEARA